MSLYNMNNVTVVGSLQELGDLLFRGEDGEAVSPSPYTFVLFTSEGLDQPGTLNQLLCSRGEEAIYEVLSEYMKPLSVDLVVAKMNISQASRLMYHPCFLLHTFPTLLSLDGERRLVGSELLDRQLLRDLFSRESIIEDLQALYQHYFPESVTAPTLFEPLQDSPPAPLHPDLVFWRVKEAVKREAEARQELQDYGVNSEEDRQRLCERIRQEFVRCVKVEDLKPEETGEYTEEIVPFDLDLLVEDKEEYSIDRKPLPLTVQPSSKDKIKKKGKGKKSKNAGKGKGKGQKGKGKGKKGKK